MNSERDNDVDRENRTEKYMCCGLSSLITPYYLHKLPLLFSVVSFYDSFDSLYHLIIKSERIVIGFHGPSMRVEAAVRYKTLLKIINIYFRDFIPLSSRHIRTTELLSMSDILIYISFSSTYLPSMLYSYEHTSVPQRESSICWQV